MILFLCAFAPLRDFWLRTMDPEAEAWGMKENEIATRIVDAAYRLHSGLGPGIFEVVYEVSLAHELRKHGYIVERQVPVPIIWDGITFDEGFRADLIIDDCVLVEVKSVAALDAVHSKQVLTYLR